MKTWLYFKVMGFPDKSSVRFTVRWVNMLLSQYSQKKNDEGYRPVYRIGQSGVWEFIPDAPTFQAFDDNELDLTFQFTFNYGYQTEVYFSLTVPFSYQDNQTFLQQLNQLYGNDEEIYFSKELLIESEQKRGVDLITITSQEKENENKKGIIVVSGRIHPGETPSSEDKRAQMLRKHFIFKFVPMLNPDGVFNGNFRMDTSNQNLNRYYQQPEKKKQPPCYALLKLLKKLAKVTIFIDIHAHSQAKSAFVYGNALEDFVSMVETQLFPKLISLNTQHFDFDSCNFSEKQMAAIDRFEYRSKEGSARVQSYKQFGIIHSYTLECGFHQL